jgi:hypothetical protein
MFPQPRSAQYMRGGKKQIPISNPWTSMLVERETKPNEKIKFKP